MEIIRQLLELLVTTRTRCETCEISSTSFVSGPSIKAKVVEVKNRTGVNILVNPNDSKPFPIQNGEDRLFVVKNINDLKFARESGTGTINIHLIYED